MVKLTLKILQAWALGANDVANAVLTFRFFPPLYQKSRAVKERSREHIL